MDYYGTLGLKRGASDAEIKKAYRSLAMKHHPDRGGDEKKFKDLNAAYESLTNPDKKKIIDMGGDPNAQPGPSSGFYGQGPFEFHFGGPDMNDIFGQFGFGRGFANSPRRNKTVSLHVDLSLEEVLSGRDITAEINLPGSKNKVVNVHIPPGVHSGQQIRYQGMGDTSIPGIPPGDLIVNINVRNHPKFIRENNDLIYNHNIDLWSALLGGSLTIDTLDNRTINITIPKGIQPDTMLSCRGEGLPDVHHRHRGNLFIKFKIELPRNLTQDQLSQIEKWK
jgi:curved DNA-binding protein